MKFEFPAISEFKFPAISEDGMSFKYPLLWKNEIDEEDIFYWEKKQPPTPDLVKKGRRIIVNKLCDIFVI